MPTSPLWLAGTPRHPPECSACRDVLPGKPYIGILPPAWSGRSPNPDQRL